MCVCVTAFESVTTGRGIEQRYCYLQSVMEFSTNVRVPRPPGAPAGVKNVRSFPAMPEYLLIAS